MHKLEEPKGSSLIAKTAPFGYAHLLYILRECPGIVMAGFSNETYAAK